MSINYDAIKHSLTQAQRDLIEGESKKRKRKIPPAPAPSQSILSVTSAPSAGWVNCEYGCMGRNNGPKECDVCGGKMVPGPSSGLTPRQLKKK